MPVEKRNILMRRVGSVVVFRQNKRDATEEEWDDFLKFLVVNRDELPNMKMLIKTDGGVPSAAQRKKLAGVLGEMQPMVSVVSDAMKVRFAGSTIALFQKNYGQFTNRELQQAMDHLSIPQADRRPIQEALVELERALLEST